MVHPHFFLFFFFFNNLQFTPYTLSPSSCSPCDGLLITIYSVLTLINPLLFVQVANVPETFEDEADALFNKIKEESNTPVVEKPKAKPKSVKKVGEIFLCFFFFISPFIFFFNTLESKVLDVVYLHLGKNTIWRFQDVTFWHFCHVSWIVLIPEHTRTSE